jgi:hypothetical protein
MTVVMLTGACNADCTICYTDRRKKPAELAAPEIIEIMDQTFALGSRLLYLPGEGEVLLDRGLFAVLDHARSIGMNVILFSNGILFSNDKQAVQQWGMSSEDLVRRLSEYPVYVYHKLWSTEPDLIAEMMNVHASTYDYADYDVNGQHVHLPRGIDLLLRYFPRERIGVETVVERRNWQEIVDVIIPLVQKLGIKSYIEPLLHAGRCFGVSEFDPPEQAKALLGQWLARQNCRRVAYYVVVQNDGVLSPGMALPSAMLRSIYSEDDFSRFVIRDNSGGIKDLFSMLHTNTQLVQLRYRIRGCLCEEVNSKLAKAHPPGGTYAKPLHVLPV